MSMGHRTITSSLDRIASNRSLCGQAREGRRRVEAIMDISDCAGRNLAITRIQGRCDKV